MIFSDLSEDSEEARGQSWAREKTSRKALTTLPDPSEP
jgi:hypothetical protein